MNFEYYPRGVCSRKMTFDVENGIVKELKVEGGCSGNLQGISSLVKGLPVDEVINRLSGIAAALNRRPAPRRLPRR